MATEYWAVKRREIEESINHPNAHKFGIKHRAYLKLLLAEIDRLDSLAKMLVQVGWYHPGEKRLCYLDEKSHANQMGGYNGYTIPIYIKARKDTHDADK